MASFYAELHLGGAVYSVWQCSYSCHQTTDGRGRVRTKVRQGPLELVLDVPTDDGLLSWANTPHKPMAGQVVFYYLAEQVAHETIAFAAGECVSYTEQFEAGALREGAYRCQLVITAPQFEMLAGGPAAAAPVGAGQPATQLGGDLAAGTLLAGAAEAGSAGSALPAAAQAASAAIATPKAIAKEVNPAKGMQNCIPITQAVVARLRGTDPTATAPDVPFGNLETLEKAHGTTVEFGKDFSQVFEEMRAAGEGAIGVIVLLPLDGGMGHVVTITNHEGTPTIIEGQNWGPYHPAEANTSLSRAERRYGDTTTHMIGLGMIPPLPAAPAAT